MAKADSVSFHPAKLEELTSIVDLLADDFLGAVRENTNDSDLENYRRFFQLIESDANNTVYLAKRGRKIVGVFQLTYIPNMTFGGSWRAQVEGVRVVKTCRGQGIGKIMMEWIIEQARKRDCIMVQLTSNKQRPEALDFYLQLGFEASHEGFKKVLR